jgi:arylsulfatase A-like enzyme
MVLAVAGCAVFMVTRADWRVLNLGPVVALCQFLVFQGLLWVLVRRTGRKLVAGRIPWYLAAGSLLMAAAGLLYSATAFNRSQALTAAALDHSWAGSTFLRLGRALTDGDGDGYAAYFGGGDCNDRSSKIHPGARDLPGDGIDQDCLGGEARPPAKPIRIDRRKLKPKDPLKTFRFEGNFLVIIVDTLREDRLGIEKYRRKLTPNIDRLLAESVFFRKAYAQGNRTPHSFGSFLTSRYPSKVKWKKRRHSYSPLLDDNLMVFEALQKAGYRNLAVLRHFYFHPTRNLQQGFAEGDYVNRPQLSIGATNTDIAAPDITARAIKRLEELKKEGKKFCLWVHYPDPHSRYMRHKQYPITLKGFAGLEQKYDFEIRHTDVYVGKLLDALRKTGLDKNTAVVFFSDHAEAFGRHRFKGKRMFFHGQTLYNELLHVPLSFRVPGIKPAVIEDRVMLLDIAPTMIDMLRKPVPEEFMGASLVPYFFGKHLPERPIRAELLPYTHWKHHMVSMIRGKWKLIYRISDNIFELYDLEKDPHEMKNVASKNPDVLKKLKAEIRNY